MADYRDRAREEAEERARRERAQKKKDKLTDILVKEGGFTEPQAAALLKVIDESKKRP